MGSIDAAHRSKRVDEDGKDSTDEHEEVTRRVSDAEPQNGDWRPGNGWDRTHCFDDRLEQVRCHPGPARDQANQDPTCGRKQETNKHSVEASKHMSEERAIGEQFYGGLDHTQRGWQ